MTRRMVPVIAVALTLATGALMSMSRADGFPHERHAGLFPTCLGCHQGIPTGQEERYYSVTPRDCVRCHDGEREGTVEWDAPARTPSNLVFVHAEHIEEVERAGDAEVGCADCHGPLEPGRPRMAVGRAEPATCTECHAHTVSEHLAVEASCTDCHTMIADTPELSAGRIASFPRPPTHDSSDFIFAHAELAEASNESCAVCHARQSCVRCHLNADALAPVTALAPDSRIAQLVSDEPPEWPEPSSHERQGWEFEHASGIESAIEGCANCHAQASCRTCHGDAPIAAIAALPEPGEGEPRGVTVPRTRPPGHTAEFATKHGSAAAANLPDCSSCHTESQCADCHAGPSRVAGAFTPGRNGPDDRSVDRSNDASPGAANPYRHQVPPETPSDARPGYHPANFLLRHGAEAFAVQTVCSDCHSTEAFCRECHRSTGISIGPAGGAGGAFHDAQPNWLFEHGRAARQGLEACASCHQQTSCLRCHSARSGLRISPHGPGFDADRVAARSTISCGICHTAEQIPPP